MANTSIICIGFILLLLGTYGDCNVSEIEAIQALLNITSDSEIIGDGDATFLVPGLVNISFDPSEIEKLYQGKLVDVFANISMDFDPSWPPGTKFTLNISSLNPSVASVTSTMFTFDSLDLIDDGTYRIIFQVKGEFLGRTALIPKVTVWSDNKTKIDVPVLPEKIPVAVWRTGSQFQKYFTILATAMTVITTFMMGTQVHWRVILGVLKKPIAPVIGFCCQYIIMPLIAFIWGLLLLPGQPYLQLGYFAVGCCPGGKASNFWSILLDANLDLSVTLTVVSTVASIAMMPLWMMTLGTMVISKGTDIELPFTTVVGSLALLVIPIGIGMLVRHYRPKAADFVEKLIKPVTMILVAILVTAGLSLNYYIFFLFTWQKVLAGLLLPWSGFLLAGTASWLFQQNLQDVKTIAIETGIQNASIAIIIIATSLPQPDSDLTLVMPMICLMFTPLPLLCGLIYLTIRKWIDKRKSRKVRDANGQQSPADSDKMQMA